MLMESILYIYDTQPPLFCQAYFTPNGGTGIMFEKEQEEGKTRKNGE